MGSLACEALPWISRMCRFYRRRELLARTGACVATPGHLQQMAAGNAAIMTLTIIGSTTMSRVATKPLTYTEPMTSRINNTTTRCE